MATRHPHHETPRPDQLLEFKTLDINVRKVLVSAAVSLVFLCLLDTAVRIWHPVDLYSGWGTPDIEEKMGLIDARVARLGKVDALIMGSSVGRRIDVGQWQSAFGGKVAAINACFHAQRPEIDRLMFEKVLWEKTHPSLLILTLTPFDVNGFETTTVMKRRGPIWQTGRVRRLTATTIPQRLQLLAERLSYVVAVREGLRRDLQKGRQDFIHYFLDEETAVEYPSVNRTPDDPKSPFYAKTFSGLFSRFSVPDDGEVLEIRKLAAFCRQHGVRFVVASQPVAPACEGIYPNMQQVETTYTKALEKLKNDGIELLQMQNEISVSNADFGDPLHPNGRGAQKITSYLYEKVVRPMYAAGLEESVIPETLPEPVEISPCAGDGASGGTRIDLDATNKAAEPYFGSDRQLSIEQPGATIPLGQSFAPGTYHVDIYGADSPLNKAVADKMTANGYIVYGFDTAALPYPQHEFALTATPLSGTPISPHFTSSLVLIRRNQFTRCKMSLPTTSSLSLRVDKVGEGSAVIDTVFVRRQPEPLRQDPAIAAKHQTPQRLAGNTRSRAASL